MSSTGKVIVITGASSGIGAALARQLGADSWRMALAARREDRLREVAAPFGDNALVVPTDVRRRADIESLRDRALEKFGQIDVWVSNAGRGIGKKVMELPEEDFDEMVAVNLKSYYYAMQAIIPVFQKQGRGHLINVSSTLGRIPFATYRSIYSACKSALNTLTAQLRMDLRRESPGIEVSLVMPSIVSTEFFDAALGGTPQSPGRPGVEPQTADEVAGAIARLIEHPVPELYTNPGTQETVARYYQDVAAFEAGMGGPPLARQ